MHHFTSRFRGNYALSWPLASPDLGWDGEDDPGELADCLTAIRQALQHAATRQTRFHFIIA